MKKLALVIVGVIVLLVAAVFAAPSVIDFKPWIISSVRQATGRELRIDGALSLSLLARAARECGRRPPRQRTRHDGARDAVDRRSLARG